MSDTPSTPPLGLLLCDDLMFASRITGTARDLGFRMQTARSPAVLEALVRAQTPQCIVVDLANQGLDIAALMATLRAICSPPPRVVAYGSHVDAATLKAGREAGCEPVLPRSKFVEELPRALAQWMAGPG